MSPPVPGTVPIFGETQWLPWSDRKARLRGPCGKSSEYKEGSHSPCQNLVTLLRKLSQGLVLPPVRLREGALHSLPGPPALLPGRSPG